MPVSVETQNENVNLPSSWYRSDAIYQLERRAIFSKKWLFLCHTNRFTKTGEYIKFAFAGYNIFAIKDREGQINAFHNVCRHRAFPVVGTNAKRIKENLPDPLTESGQVAVLHCKFHGWSYTMKGDLAKAPGFDEVENFDPKKNSLFGIRTHIDQLGYLYVNLDTSEDYIKWEEQFGDVDSQPRVQGFDTSKYKYAFSWSFENCQYNWKTLVDNYNECYHCKVAHPGIASTVDLKTYYVQGQKGYVAHFSPPKPENKEKEVDGSIVATFLFPFASITLMPAYAYTMRVVPIDAHRTEMQYDVYRPEGASDEDFDSTHQFFLQVEEEDKFLCTNAQKNMEAGIYQTGSLHTRQEHGVLHFQSLVKESLMSHRAAEEAAGREIFPALPDGGRQSKEDAFCKKLESTCGTPKMMEW
ncbi:Rieske domain-containing protein [Stereum hirsutum FP-91666 SS1]|uniref:Rieske domain-containing protein n=1 Tax=Stereum hirsutum (strain FP-91666) TaxID=721885 RepID=UPI000440ADF0|nr:Rieske domain-containing protein [Stereum hirsutum FP-91666 SS1]EIM87664.1 Rieske domain-containing protein [Stereum hirsutum FP-91666 SS1]